jgi:hypothetical protein
MLATKRNRMIAHLNSQPKASPLPATPRECLQIWTDGIFDALATLRKHLQNDDPAVAVAAASAILDLEKTRMRHGLQVSGTTVPLTRPEEGPAEQDESETEAFTVLVDETHRGMEENQSELPENERHPIPRSVAEQAVLSSLLQSGAKPGMIPKGTFYNAVRAAAKAEQTLNSS